MPLKKDIPTPKPALSGKVIIIILLLALAVGAFWFAPQYLRGDYGGWITGLAPEVQGSTLVAYDPENNRSKVILSLPEVAPDNYGAVSPDGKYAAYTQWNDAGTVRYLVVQQLTGFKKSKEEFFKEVSGMQEVKYLSWFPDSRRILFVRTDTTDEFPYQEICIFDVVTKKVTIADTGGVWDGRTVETVGGSPSWVNIMTQDQLNKLLAKYGGGIIPVEEIARKLWVEFSAPSVSPDGEKIAYSATLVRNTADESRNLRLASGIWVIDLNGGGPRRTYVNADHSYSVDRVIWTSAGNSLAFSQCRGVEGEEEKIDCLDLPSYNLKPLVHSTVKYFTNFGLLALPDNVISFLSIPQYGSRKDAVRYTISPEMREIRLQSVNISPRGKQLLNFTNLYREQN